MANDPYIIIMQGGKSMNRLGNPVIKLQIMVEVVQETQLAQRSISLDVIHTFGLISMASDGTVRMESPMNSHV